MTKDTLIIVALICTTYGASKFLSYLENLDRHAERIHEVESIRTVCRDAIEAMKAVTLEK